MKIKKFKPYSSKDTRSKAIWLTAFAVVGVATLLYTRAEVPTADLNIATVTTISEAENEKQVTEESLKLANQLERQEAHTATKDSPKQVRDIAAARKKKMTRLIAENPGKAVRLGLSTELRDQLPGDVKANVEEQKTIKGTLEITIVESWDQSGLGIIKANAASADEGYDYSIKAENGTTYSVHFAGEGPTDLANKQVSVKGITLDSEMAADTAESSVAELNTTATEALSVPAPSSYRKAAIVLFNFSNDASQPVSVADARAAVFTSDHSANNFFKENSLGQFGLTGKLYAEGDVFGYYTIPLNSTDTVCDYRLWSNQAKATAEAAGVNFDGYDNILYMFPDKLMEASVDKYRCRAGGFGELRAKNSWYPLVPYSYGTYGGKIYRYLPLIVAHELGHNLGAHHANSYACKDAAGNPATLGLNCANPEYGDTFNAMGSPRNFFDCPGTENCKQLLMPNFSIFHKEQVNFLTPSNVTTLASSGRHTIAPLEFKTGGVQGLRFVRERDPAGKPLSYYYFDYRQPSAFDNFPATSDKYNGYSGVTARITPDPSVMEPTKLLHAHPEDTTFGKASFLPGETFSDPERQLSVKVVSVSPAGAVVDVVVGPPKPVCERRAPTLTVDPSNHWVTSGQPAKYWLTVTNTDSLGCAPATYTLTVPGDTARATAGVAANIDTPNVTLAPGASGNATVVVTSQASTPTAPYTITAEVDSLKTSPWPTTFVSFNYNAAYQEPPKPAVQSPFTVPFNIPGPIALPHYDKGGEGLAYHDTTLANTGSGAATPPRPTEAVDINVVAGGNMPGSTAIGGAYVGEWVEYTINVPTAGTYTPKLHAANATAGGIAKLQLADSTTPTDLALFTIPNTGAWNTFQTVTAPNITLSQGAHVLRLLMHKEAAGGGVADLSWMALETPTTTPTDTTPPSIQITAPFADTTISGTYKVSVNATDAVGVTGVDFYVDGGAVRLTDTTSPYSYDLDTTKFSNGSHKITAYTYDAAENINHADVTVTFNNSTTVIKKCDFNKDNKVDSNDLFVLLANFNKTVTAGTKGDCNASGKVDTNDLFILLGIFGK